MIWAIVVAAALVAGVAAIASTGRLGEMPPPIDEAFVGRRPDPLTPETLPQVEFATVLNGYDRTQVRAHIAALAAGEDAECPRFLVRSIGYHKGQVDDVFAQFAWMRNNGVLASQEESREQWQP